MTFCMLTGVGTWTNWSSFVHDPDYSSDARTGLLSAISYALQCGILLRWENPMGMVIGRPSQERRVVLRRRNQQLVGAVDSSPSASDRAFPVAAARAWNSTLKYTRDCH